MAFNETLNKRVREALAEEPNVVEKVMPKGVLFMINGKICLSTDHDELMCRIDHALHQALVEKPGVRTMEMKGKPFKGYIMVHADVLKTQKQVSHWVNLALDFNKKAKAAPKKKK